MPYFEWKPYVPVAERRRNALREMQRLKKKGHPVSPVLIEGRAIARTFWGKAWCDNLEGYSDYASRLPRGRTYVRNGSVVDLQIAQGEVRAMVSGSALYKVAVKVSPVPKARWTSICTDCAGAVDSLVELLQGRFSKGVMERICRQTSGLFPAPTEIAFSCSCPDWASMCKHVAAVLYAIGARLDEQSELLFKLRKVDQQDLIAKAGKGLSLPKQGPGHDKVLASDDLSELFGLELATDDPPAAVPTPRELRVRRAAKTRAAAATVAVVAATASTAARRSTASSKKATKTGRQAPRHAKTRKKAAANRAGPM